MKSPTVDECLAASSHIIATTRSKLTQLQFSLETCLTCIEVSADAIAASQALLAKLNGEPLPVVDGADAVSSDAEQTSDDPSPASDGAASLV